MNSCSQPTSSQIGSPPALPRVRHLPRNWPVVSSGIYPGTVIPDGIVHGVGRQVRPVRPGNGTRLDSELPEDARVPKRFERGSLDRGSREKRLQVYISCGSIDECDADSKAFERHSADDAPGCREWRYHRSVLRCLS